MEEKALSEKPIEKPKKDWLKITVFSFVGLILLFGAAYGGYWYGVQQSRVEAPKLAIPTPILAPLPTPTPTPHLTTDWKTYTNTEYGYSIKYPKDWKFETNTVPELGFYVTFSKINRDGTDRIPSSNISVLIVHNPRELSLEEWLLEKTEFMPGSGKEVRKDIYKLSYDGSPSTIYVDGTKAYKWLSKAGNRQVVFERDRTIYSVGTLLQNRKFEEETKDIFDLILSTFKFLD